MLVKDLAAWLGASYEGDPNLDLLHVASLEEAGPEDLSFVSHKKSQRYAADSQAGCLLVPLDFPNDQNRTLIRVIDPRAAITRAIPKLHPPVKPAPGIHPTAVIDPEAQIAKNVSVGPQAVIGKSVIGGGTIISAGAESQTM